MDMDWSRIGVAVSVGSGPLVPRRSNTLTDLCELPGVRNVIDLSRQPTFGLCCSIQVIPRMASNPSSLVAVNVVENGTESLLRAAMSVQSDVVLPLAASTDPSASLTDRDDGANAIL